VELVRKEVPIIMPTTGLVKSGFKLEKIVLSPERLIIRGPLEEVQKIKNIQLQEIDLSSIGESTRLERRIELLAPNTTPSVNLVEVDLVVIPAIEAVEQFNGAGADVSGQVIVPVAKQSPKSVKLGTQTKN
jgi:YbbR domain-containing protein